MSQRKLIKTERNKFKNKKKVRKVIEMNTVIKRINTTIPIDFYILIEIAAQAEGKYN